MSGFGYLVSQIVFCLLIAAALGFLIGWLWRALLADRKAAESDRDWSARLEGAESARRDLDSRLRVAEQEHAGTLEERDRSLAALTADLEGQTEEFDARSKELSAAQEKLSLFAADEERLRSELGSAQELAKKAEQRTDKMASEETRLRQELVRLGDRQKATEQKNHACQTELESLGNQLTQCQEANSNHKTTVEELRSELAACHEAGASNKQDSMAKIAALQTTAAEQNRLHGEADSRIAELERDLAACLEAQSSATQTEQTSSAVASEVEGQLAERDLQIQQLQQQLAAMDKLAAESGEPLEPDDLQRIHGVGPVLEKMLNGVGIFTFRQIAAWDAADIAWAAAKLDAFSDRIERDQWVTQANQFYREKLANES